MTVLEGVILPWGDPSGHLRRSVITGLAAAYEFDPNTPWGDLNEEARHAIIHGAGGMKIRFPYTAGAGRVEGTYEGHWGRGPATGVMEFDAVEAARAWYNAGAYQSVIGERDAAADSNAVIVSGFEMPGA